MIDWNYVVIGLSLFLLFFLIRKEVRRSNRARLGWRLIATILAVISFACLALPITYNHTEAVGVTKEAVLLTDGFSRDSVNKFISQNNAVPVLTTNKNLSDAAKFNAVFVPDISLLSRTYSDITTFHVFGYGMSKDELQHIKKGSVIFHPTKLSAGISSISWNQKMKTGEKLFIQGRVENSTSGKLKIVLKSFNATLDSVALANGNNQRFELTTIPKHGGRAVYSIVFLSGKDTIEKELVPVQIEQGAALKVLMLAATPDFENRFLKDRLGEKGYKVVARTTISKNKFRKDYLNTSPLPVDRITTSLLNNFDIAIADAAALQALSKTEQATLQGQVALGRMGLIVKVDSGMQSSSFYGRRFPLVAQAGNQDQNIQLKLSDTSSKLPALAIENPIFIRSVYGTQPVVMDKQNRVFANSTLMGAGKIILTTITNTFSWALSGYQNEYDQYWSELLNKAAPKKTASEVWGISPAFPAINQPAQLQVETSNAGVPHGQIGEASVFLKAHSDLPFRWEGTYYPTSVGWRTGVQMDGVRFYWYAYNKQDWTKVRAAETLEATRQFVTENGNTVKASEKVLQTTKAEFPKIVFFMLFLLFAGYLWVENKF
ncbi:hypothetical protein [Segetibacter aerophilus]|uniref:Aerotolerance regulator N-terminal domain-containing protein n=1 Tax=Segetibacter aerophilus TaxID=670293 RepID=A0A512B8Q6_9BACT|nr:hypothetical protein [Segetibacter aerophilus]GEO08344.1 hypothetical protein SAE01_08400 [Segetibacter aerophilus]